MQKLRKTIGRLWQLDERLEKSLDRFVPIRLQRMLMSLTLVIAFVWTISWFKANGVSLWLGCVGEILAVMAVAIVLILCRPKKERAQ
jgi:membrane protein YdbS with pleckstrin-like domain